MATADHTAHNAATQWHRSCEIVVVEIFRCRRRGGAARVCARSSTGRHTLHAQAFRHLRHLVVQEPEARLREAGRQFLVVSRVVRVQQLRSSTPLLRNSERARGESEVVVETRGVAM